MILITFLGNVPNKWVLGLHFDGREQDARFKIVAVWRDQIEAPIRVALFDSELKLVDARVNWLFENEGVLVGNLLAQRLIEMIALARKAGRALAGREKVLTALIAGDAAVLLQASDGSARERTGVRPPESENSHVLCLDGAELGMAFGRDRVVHAAVLTGGLAERVKVEALRLSGVRCEQHRQAFGDGADVSEAGEGPRGKG